MLVDLEALRATQARATPFPHVVVRGFLDAQALAQVTAEYPEFDVPGLYLPGAAAQGSAVQKLISDLESDELRAVIAEKLDIDLDGSAALVTFRSRCRTGDGEIHTDSKSKRASLLLYLNENWTAPGGRLRLLHSGDNIDDFAEEIAPVAGNFVAFRVQHNSWHGHLRYAGPRRCVMVNYFCSPEVRDAEARRHKASLPWKRLRRAVLGPGKTEASADSRGGFGGDATSSAIGALARARDLADPFHHIVFEDLLPEKLARAVARLPIEVPCTDEHPGRRDAFNPMRTFFSPALQATHPACAEICQAFKSAEIVGLLERKFGRSFSGSFLRIEYCQDGEGFWLEPHTDIGAKLLTLTLFLSDDAGSEDWGTDLYDGEKRHVARVPAGFNRGYAFAPGTDTWHGVEPRIFGGIRRSIIVNYVKPEWRSRHELAAPLPVT